MLPHLLSAGKAEQQHFRQCVNWLTEICFELEKINMLDGHSLWHDLLTFIFDRTGGFECKECGKSMEDGSGNKGIMPDSAFKIESEKLQNKI